MSDNLHQALRELKERLYHAAEAVNQKGLTQYEYGFLGAQDYATQTVEQLLNQFPEPETTTDWGTRNGDGSIINWLYEETARNVADERKADLLTREVGAWQKADQT